MLAIISMKGQVFKRLDITRIWSNADDLTFEVGIVTAMYHAKNFDQSPDCEGNWSSA